jgi:hypothetical protein
MSMSSKRKSSGLKERYGDEYDRTVSEAGKRKDAEKELQEREKRVERLKIKELSDDQRQRYADDWRGVQARFVDNPESSIKEADDLVQKVMDARGYPITDFEQQAADVSVDHPQVVANYREAHAIAMRHSEQGVSTEELRQAMIHYRALFNELLGTPVGSATS